MNHLVHPCPVQGIYKKGIHFDIIHDTPTQIVRDMKDTHASPTPSCLYMPAWPTEAHPPKSKLGGGVHIRCVFWQYKRVTIGNRQTCSTLTENNANTYPLMLVMQHIVRGVYVQQMTMVNHWRCFAAMGMEKIWNAPLTVIFAQTVALN